MKKYTLQHLFYTLSFAAIIAVPLMFFSSCDFFAYKRIFPDAYYENNFIEKIGFDLAIASDAALPAADLILGEIIPASASWDFAWRYENGYPSGTTPFPYMTLTPVTELAGDFGATSEGLSATAPVFRLEVKNLISDGDFEGVEPLGNWTRNLDPTAFALLSSSDNINGNSLQIDISKTGDFATYSIDMLPGAAVVSVGYDLFFKWGAETPPSEATAIAYVNDSNSRVNFSSKKSELVRFNSIASNILSFKYKSGFSFIIDDLSLKRTLNKPKLRLRLSPGDTEPALMNMLYRFSVWVCADPEASTEKSPYHLTSFALNIEQLQTNEINSMTIGAGMYTYNAGFSGWRKITAWVSDGGNPQFSEESLTPVLELVLSLADSLPGQVLLAQPELRAYPDGY